MQAIADLSWMKHLRAGQVIERFVYRGFHVVALKMEPNEHQPQTQYQFRLLFFPKGEPRPVLALNLESSILGSSCLTEQIGGQHRNLGPAADELSYAVFKEWALGKAANELVEPAAS